MAAAVMMLTKKSMLHSEDVWVPGAATDMSSSPVREPTRLRAAALGR